MINLIGGLFFLVAAVCVSLLGNQTIAVGLLIIAKLCDLSFELEKYTKAMGKKNV